MNQKEIIKSRDIAEEHWEFIEKWLHTIYVGAFIHGYKHGKNDRNGL